MDFQVLGLGVLDTVIYSLVGIVMMGIGFLLINFFTPFSVKKEIEDDQNTSLGIIIGAIIIGISSPSSNSQNVRAVVQESQTK